MNGYEHQEKKALHYYCGAKKRYFYSRSSAKSYGATKAGDSIPVGVLHCYYGVEFDEQDRPVHIADNDGLVPGPDIVTDAETIAANVVEVYVTDLCSSVRLKFDL